MSVPESAYHACMVSTQYRGSHTMYTAVPHRYTTAVYVLISTMRCRGDARYWDRGIDRLASVVLRDVCATCDACVFLEWGFWIRSLLPADVVLHDALGQLFPRQKRPLPPTQYTQL
eukprot:165372-Rhodomonas_salina.3